MLDKQLSKRELEVVSRMRNMYNSMVEEKDQIQDLIDEVLSYFRPYRLSSMFSDGYDLSSGSKIFDGEPIAAKNRLSSGLFAWLISPSIDWLQFEPSGDATTMGADQYRLARIFADDCERYTYNAFMENNFYEQMAVAIDEMVTAGTEALIIEPNDEIGQVHFQALKINEFLTSDNRFGKSDTLIRRIKLRNRNLVQMFPDRFDKDEKEKLLRDSEKMSEVLHFMYPAVEGDRFYGKMPIASNYMYSSNLSSSGVSGSAMSRLLAERGMTFQQFTVGKYEEIPGHSYGNCPTFNALYDTKMINSQSKTMNDMAQLAASPPLIADDGLRGSLRIAPKGVTYRERPDYDVRGVFGSIGNYPLGMDSMERRAKIIREHFKSDFFMAISGIQNSSRERTRAEIMALQAEGAAALSETVGSLNRLLIEPTIVAFMQIEQSRGRWPKPPEGLNNTPFVIRFKGPLAQAQRQYVNQQSVVSGLVTASQFATVDRNVPKKFDYLTAASDIARDLGVPEKYINPDELVAQMIQAEAEQQQAMMSAEMEERKIKSMPAAAKAPEPGSYLEKMFAAGLGGA